MTDIKVKLLSKKDILVSIPEGIDLKEAFNEVSSFIHTLEANRKIRDLESGVNPPGATHEIVREKDDTYRLRRLRFS